MCIRDSHLTLGLDDSGSKSTGRLQGSATFAWDNVLTLNDRFYICGTRSFKRESDDAEGHYGSKNISLYYSIPWKNYLLTPVSYTHLNIPTQLISP